MGRKSQLVSLDEIGFVHDRLASLTTEEIEMEREKLKENTRRVIEKVSRNGVLLRKSPLSSPIAAQNAPKKANINHD